jgi:predicted nucleic acid-binding Zn ribbon protein
MCAIDRRGAAGRPADTGNVFCSRSCSAVQCSAAKRLRTAAHWSRIQFAARAVLVLVVVLVARAASRRRQASSAASAQTCWSGSGNASDMHSSVCWSSCSSTSINVLVFVSRGVSVIGTYLGDWREVTGRLDAVTMSLPERVSVEQVSRASVSCCTNHSSPSLYSEGRVPKTVNS